MDLKNYIRSIPDFPKEGILFYDISTLLAHPDAWQVALGRMAKMVTSFKPDILAGIESRGFLMSAPLSSRMGLGSTMIRKKGKLPGEVIEYQYDLEYGTDTIEIHQDAFQPGERIIVIDDVLATGGTLGATLKLIRSNFESVEIVETAFLIELDFLNGREKLKDTPIHSLIHY